MFPNITTVHLRTNIDLFNFAKQHSLSVSASLRLTNYLRKKIARGAGNPG